jgi:hypothetical protein
MNANGRANITEGVLSRRETRAPVDERMFRHLVDYPPPYGDKSPAVAYLADREELLALARHWIKVRIDMAHGRCEDEELILRVDAYAATRLARIATLVGDEPLWQILRELDRRDEIGLPVAAFDSEDADEQGDLEDSD